MSRYSCTVRRSSRSRSRSAPARRHQDFQICEWAGLSAAIGHHREVFQALAHPLRPGRNSTGSSFFVPKLNAKRLEILKEAVPRLSRVGVLLKRGNAVNAAVLRTIEHTARSLKLELQPVEARDPADLEGAVSAVVGGQAGALVVQDDPVLLALAAQIADLARRNQLPTIGFVEYAQAGGLLAFGVNFPDLWRRAAVHVDKILKGAKPADLLIERPTKYELIINLRTAKALGLTIPASLLARRRSCGSRASGSTTGPALWLIIAR